MKKMLVLTCALALLVGTTTLADHYATKADYKAGKLTPSAPIPKGSGDQCSDALVDIAPVTLANDYNFTGDTAGSTIRLRNENRHAAKGIGIGDRLLWILRHDVATVLAAEKATH